MSLLTLVWLLIPILLAAILLWSGYRRLEPGQRALRLRLGRPLAQVGPGGAVLLLPLLDQLQFVPSGEAPFHGQSQAILDGCIRLQPRFQGIFTIADAMAAHRALAELSAPAPPALSQLEKYVSGALSASLPGLFEAQGPSGPAQDPALIAGDPVRLARLWAAAADSLLQTLGLRILQFSVVDPGLPPHLAAEWQLRAYQAAEPYPTPEPYQAQEPYNSSSSRARLDG